MKEIRKKQPEQNNNASNAPQLYHRQHAPTIAPGLEDDELQENATEQDVQEGNTTMVTRLSWDENDNGSRE